MATSDTEAAWRRLEVVRTQLQRLARRHHPDDRERQAHSAGLIDDYHNLRADRLVEACTAAAMAISSAVVLRSNWSRHVVSRDSGSSVQGRLPNAIVVVIPERLTKQDITCL